MGAINPINFDYLTDKEIMDLYELFFGVILIKKSGFSYYDNLSKNLNKEEPLINVLSKLNDIEKNILKLLSFTKFIPYKFIVGKLSIIFNISNVIVNRALNNLIEKKYIFLRNGDLLVIPNIFFDKEKAEIPIKKIDLVTKEKHNKFLYDINNLIICFISKEIKFSNNFNLYKKDFDLVKEFFSSYSKFNDSDLSLISYFYCCSFFDKENNLLINDLKKYIELKSEDKIQFIIKNTMPWFYHLLQIFKGHKSVKITIEVFKLLYYYSFLMTPYSKDPVKIDFENILVILTQLGVIEYNKKENEIIFNFLSKEINDIKDQVKLTTSFNIYINSDSNNPNYYLIAFFADLIKYNKISEFEITEQSIKRANDYGVIYNDIIDFFSSYNVEIPKNVETTIKQWFDKFGSYYYTSGTVFFCQSPDKGKIINTLIDKGLINAYPIKKDEIFLVAENDKETFFDFLQKTGINYIYKKPQYPSAKEKDLIVEFNNVIKFVDLS